MKIAICAMVRDEAATLPEWLAHHLAIGFDIGELLLGNDGVFRQNVGPPTGPRIGEIAIDAANAGLADLGNLLEQSIRDLCGCIVGVDQDRETGERSSAGMAFPKKDATTADGYTDVGALAARPDFFQGIATERNPAQSGFTAGAAAG